MHQTVDGAPRHKLSEIFSKEEIARLTARSGVIASTNLFITARPVPAPTPPVIGGP